MQPTDVLVTNITSRSMNIKWTVSGLAYSPENYTILLGTSGDSLISETTVSSTVDFAALDVVYMETVGDLHPATEYYFQIQSSNLNGSVVTETQQFTTLEDGTYYVLFSVPGVFTTNHATTNFLS